MPFFEFLVDEFLFLSMFNLDLTFYLFLVLKIRKR